MCTLGVATGKYTLHVLRFAFLMLVLGQKWVVLGAGGGDQLKQ